MARILLIDDDPTVRYAMKAVLERAGHQVDEASDGRIGVQKYIADRPDLVVTDIVMPHQDGLETIRQLRALAPELPIIAVSGGNKDDDADVLATASGLGATRTMAKPFRPKVLVEAVAKLAV